MPQLTLTLDDDLLQAAQEYARQHGQVVEELVTRLLTEVVRPAAGAPASQPAETLSPRLQRLYGALKAPADFDYKQELEDGLAEKYGL